MPPRPSFIVERPGFHLAWKRSDGEAARRPEEGSGFVQCDIDNEHSVRWRGIVGTLVAAYFSIEPIGETRHFSAWPEGYSMWTKPRANNPNRYDYYLYGRRGGPFRSPIEFVPHAFFLFSDGEHRNPIGCQCTVCTRRLQGTINSILFGKERIRISRDNIDAVAQYARGQRQLAGVRNHAEHAEPNVSDGTSDAQVFGILHNLYEGSVIDERRAPDPERQRDQANETYRLNELVWVSIPTIRHHNRQDLGIRLWPGIINNRDTRAGSTHYLVVLLGVGRREHDFKRDSLMPYWGYSWLPALVEQLANARPAVAVGERLDELHGFQPLSIPGVPPQLARTYENALAPLAVAKHVADTLCGYQIPSLAWNKPPTDEDGKTYDYYQGCWIGPERIWEDDMVRIALTWPELQTAPWRHRLLPQPPGSENRGIVMKVISFVQQDDGIYAKGTLHELVTGGSAAIPQGPYPLPAPPGYRFRSITVPKYTIHLPLRLLMGRYYSVEFMNSSLARHQKGNHRINALFSLKPAHGVGNNAAHAQNQVQEMTRVDQLNAAFRDARRVLYPEWSNGMYD